MKKWISMFMVAVMVTSMTVTVLAEGTRSGTQNNGVAGSPSNVPVTLNADATKFSVTVPTALPTSLDAETGTTTVADNAVITNNSYGKVVVSRIEVKDNSVPSVSEATWHLDDFEKDMSQVRVDSNLVGIQIKPQRGNSASTGTAIQTTGDNSESQILLSGGTYEWTLSGKDATDSSNTLKIVYATNISPVSSEISDTQIANVVFTIGWCTDI